MDISLDWLGPIDLQDAVDDGLIYSLPTQEIEAIPTVPGVYVFARVHGRAVSPLYIGKAGNVRKRISQQFNNLRLMRGLEDAPAGFRTLHLAIPAIRRGQKAAKVITIVEQSLISAALADGFEILNKQGTKTLVHRISSHGSREARRWLPGNEIHLRRGA